MDFNKIAAGILAASVVFVGTFIISETIFKPDHLEKQAYVIDTGAAQTADAGGGVQAPTFLQGAEFAALVDKANPKDGEQIIKKCVACHAFEKDGSHKVGPKLWGVFEAPVPHHADYKYSDALKALGGKWDIDHLNHWLYKPAAFAKGNKMSFAGIPDDAQRASLIAYLKTLK